MKAFKIILKILAALAAVAGIVYVVATYGDKIVAWARKTWDMIADRFGCCCCDCCCDGDCDCDGECECCCEEAPEAPAAEEADFAE